MRLKPTAGNKKPRIDDEECVPGMAEGGVAGEEGLMKNPNPPPLPKAGPTAGLEELLSGGRKPETDDEARVRNLVELGFPADMDTGLSRAVDFIPGIGYIKRVLQEEQILNRRKDPNILHNTAGEALETNLQRGSKYDTFGKQGDLQMMSEGGAVGCEDPGDKKDPLEIPEEIREYVEKAHRMRQESRPDDAWRVAPAEKKESVAPYKQDEENEEESKMTALESKGLPAYADGGLVSPFDVDGGDSTTLKMNGAGVPPQLPPPPPVPPAPMAAPTAPVAPPAEIPAPSVPREIAPDPTSQDFMGRANKILGLGPDQQASFMKLLGNNAQKGQIGAGIAGIGDAIAAGGTLGKVNPGGLAKSEDLIQNKTVEGMQGMQTLRDNQGKAQELSDKLEARDPKSPLSRWAQKAYAVVGKKIGLDLSNASAALISDVTGKGVDALNTEYQNQLKLMGLDLQKQQVTATIANQKAERAAVKEGRQGEAAKTLADRGIFKTLANAVPGTAGHAATQVLEKQALGEPVAEGPVKVNSAEEYRALPSGTHYVDSYGTQKVKK